MQSFGFCNVATLVYFVKTNGTNDLSFGFIMEQLGCDF